MTATTPQVAVSEAAADGGSTGAGEERPVLTQLPADLRAVLETAAKVVASQKSDYDPTQIGTHTAAIHDLLQLLADSVPARLLTAHTLASCGNAPDPTSLAAQVLAKDHEAAGGACSRARSAVAEVVAAARRDRRARRREAKPAATERVAARTEDRLAELRDSRDRHKAHAERLAGEVADLRGRIAELESGQADLTGLLDSSHRQLAALREHDRDPVHLASALGEALTRELDRAEDHPANSAHTDPFAHLTETGADAEGSTEDVAEAEAAAGSPGRTFVWRLVAQLRRLATPPSPAVTVDRSLRVDVLGGGAEIGGSCVLVSSGGARILVDCGARPGGTDIASMRPRHYERALQGRIDAVVITHAHNDHAGWVPALLAQRSGTPVYATPATCDLLATMWRDSAKVMSRNGVNAYGNGDVDRALDALHETPFRRTENIAGLGVELFPAGHIVGAAGVVVSAGEQRVVVSGDVSAAGQETVGGFTPSASAQGADVLLLESTYAGDRREHHPRATVVADFFAQIERVVERGGVALVPAFALGRAQEVALLCAKHAPDVPVLIDGLAREVTEVYERHPGPDGQRRAIFAGNVRRVSIAGTGDAVRSFRGGVVVTTSGMLNQGPAVRWAKRVLPDPNSALMVVGYQDEESPGARLLRLADAGGGRFSLPSMNDARDEEVEVHADVRRYQLGAHANADELAVIAQKMQARQLMLVHGEPRAQAQFGLRMRQRAQSVVETGVWTV